MTKYEKELLTMTIEKYAELKMGATGCDEPCPIRSFCDKYIELPATKNKCKQIWKLWLESEVTEND